jgi:hypothetical protein
VLLEPHRRRAIGGCLVVCAVDAWQVASGDLTVGPVGGALLYAALAAGLAAGRREAAWVAVVMPWVPLLAALAWALLGWGRAPHLLMGLVAVAQLITGFAAAQSLDLR